MFICLRLAATNLALISPWSTWLTHGEWVMAILTSIYVVLTGCYVWISRNTLTAIREQAKSNAEQFSTQLAVLKSAGEQTGELIKQAAAQATALIQVAQATEKNANAAQASAEALRASVEATTNKERARIKIDLGKVIPQAQSAGPGVNNGAACLIVNYGSTVAFVIDFRARYCLSPTPEISVDETRCKQLMYAESIPADANSPKFFLPLEPDPILTDDQVMSIREGKSSLHFYGFVKHQDVFGRNWKTTVHMRWKMRWGGVVEGTVMDYWEPVGPPGDNEEVEDGR
jgi:hypothetical protein